MKEWIPRKNYFLKPNQYLMWGKAQSCSELILRYDQSQERLEDPRNEANYPNVAARCCLEISIQRVTWNQQDQGKKSQTNLLIQTTKI